MSKYVFVLMMLTTTQLVVGQTYEVVTKLMGSRFELTAVAKTDSLAKQGVETGINEIIRIEKLISSWDSLSETSRINRNAGIKPVPVSFELFQLISRAQKLSKLTQGAFDISYAAMDKIWRFDGSMSALPSPEAVAASVKKIGYGKIVLNLTDTSVFLPETGMKIGFGAIGKGYAANRARQIMKEAGIENGLINAGGDLICWGVQENGEPWHIGIADPQEKDKIFSWLSLKEMAVVTSGNYEKFVEIGGKKYTHIIDPRTGYPVLGLKSVTVVCPDAELADGLATALFVMGEKAGLALVNQLNGIECLMVNDQNELRASDYLELHYFSEHK